MKKKVYCIGYKFLLFLSHRSDSKKIQKLKIMVGSSLLLMNYPLYTEAQYIPSATSELDTIKISTHIPDTINIFPVPPEQIEEEEENNDHIFCYVTEIMPEFPGGYLELMNFLKDNLIYPASCEEIEGKVVIQFIVREDGSIDSPVIVRSVHPLLDEAALEVIKKMPKWKPGQQRGKPIAIKYTVPLIFRTSTTQK